MLMKTLKLIFLLLFVPLVFHAQKNLTGLWVGTLSNDSSTVRKDQSFEIALTQYKEKVYGYSRSTFIINDTLYYILKRVKGTIDGEICEVKDDEIISYNFRGRLDKGIKVTTTFRKNLQDSAWRLAGEWQTNKTKKFYSISGKVELKEETNYDKSKIFPHLEELKIDQEIEFYTSAKKPATAVEDTKHSVANKKEEKKQTTGQALAKSETSKPELPTNTIGSEVKKDIASKTSEPELKKQEAVVKKDNAIPASEVIVASTTIKKSNLPASTLPTEQKKNVNGQSPKPEIKKPEPLVKRNETIVTSETIVTNTETKKSEPVTIAKPADEKKFIGSEPQQPALKIPTAAAFVEERKTVAPQIVEFKSDSLELALYDNGEIDGDTVSVLLNGEILLAKQGLKASAIKKTIYIQPGSEEVNLVLYAENLGKYPPNTGLLVVHDGEDVYQVRFSADLQKNAAVVFRRKK